ncbi:MAG TPA: DUF4190 domain-containing protein [Anaerolineales bacterium]|nr:DUF4190 domain-containing protein [Anaerolineales bacterium]HNN12009.1 DUF4190 domain-containing protein [Anaerolineales bacterium]HNO31185.1 DUF4190 domain-containing protein [Anaerolineales bacterium]
MESNEALPPSPQTNRHSVISLVLGLVTLFFFCGGVLIPIPFTSFICIPISAVIGFIALIYGVISLNIIRKSNESGSSMAWSGILMGGFIFLCLLCLVIAIASLFIFSPDSLPPILQNYQI